MLNIFGKIKNIGGISDDGKREMKIEMKEVDLMSGEYFTENTEIVIFIFNKSKMTEETSLYNILRPMVKNF